jgi:Trypsin-like peptidase domain
VKTLVLFLLLSLTAYAADRPTLQASPVDIPAVVRKAKPAVVQILTFDQENKPLARGTGFFITQDGILLTNYHVITGASRIIAKTSRGTVYALKKICGYSEVSDVAEPQFVTPKVSFLTLGPSSAAVEGEHVLVIGNPEGLEGTVSDGIISAFRDNRSWIQITAPISQGSSGSPVLDGFGQVIGIATILFRDGQNLNFAISSEAIRDAIAKSLADQSKYPVPTPTAVTRATPTPSGRRQDTPLLDQKDKRSTAQPRATAAEPPSSSSEVIRMEIPGKGITLILPADWEDIPPNTLEEYENLVARLSNNAAEARKNTMGYVFAAQHKGAGNFFAYPYLIVQVLNTGRISAAHFQDLGNSNSNPVTEAAPKIEKLFPNLLQGVKGTTITYDSTTRRFWLELTMKVVKEECHALGTMIPTENGWVEIFLYSSEKDFNFWNPVFHKIGTDAELSPSLAYQPRWTDNATINSIIETAQHMDWSRTIAYAILAAMFGIGSMIYTFITKFFQSKTK